MLKRKSYLGKRCFLFSSFPFAAIRLCDNNKGTLFRCVPFGAHFLYSENPAIVAGFHVGFADEQKAKKSAHNVLVPKAPLCKGSCQRS